MRRLRVLAAVALLAGAALASRYLAFPWLTESFNDFFEDVIGRALNLEVAIESIDTAPFSQLTLTRLTSVSAAEEGKVDLEIGEISFYYDPGELLRSRLRRLVISGPRLVLNLDADLAGVAQVPELPPPAHAQAVKLESGSNFLPFSIGETVVESGQVRLLFEGRVLDLENVELRVFELGRASGQRFELTAAAAEARVAAQGELDLTVQDGRLVPRYSFRDASIEIEGLALARSIDWIRGHTATSPQGAAHAADEETLAARFLRRLDRGAGTLSLEGKLNGVWPERVELELRSTATSLTAEYDRWLGVSGGDVQLSARATVLGRFELISFDLDAVAGGRFESAATSTTEAVSMTARGQYARSGSESGSSLRLESLRVDLQGTGRLDIAGDVASFPQSGTGRLDLSVGVTGLDARGLRSRFGNAPRAPSPLDFGGDVEAQFRVSGGLDAPRADGTCTVPVVLYGTSPDDQIFTAAVEGRFEGLEVDTGTPGWRAESLRLGARSTARLGGPLARLLEALGIERRNIAVGDAVVDARVTATDLAWSARGMAGSVDMALGLSGAALTSEDLWIETTEVGAEASLRTRLDAAPGEYPFELAADVAVDEFLVGAVHASLKGEKSRLRVEGAWHAADGGPARLRVDRLRLETPLSGRTEGKGSILLPPAAGAALAVDLELHTRMPSTERPFRTFVAEPAPDSTPLSGAQLDGDTALDVRLEGPLDALRTTGRWRLAGGRFSAGDVQLDGVELDVPFASLSRETSAAGAPPASGRVHVEHVTIDALNLGRIDLPVRLAAGAYDLIEPLHLRLLGGSLDVAALTLELAADDGPTLRLEAAASNLDLGRAPKVPDWLRIGARLDAELKRAVFRPERLEWTGSVTVRAFGGRLRLGNVRMDDPFEPYRSLTLSRGVIKGVRARELGRAFNFGVMNGVLDGRFDDLRLVGGEVTAFRLDLETVRTPGVSQFVDRQAVESIRRTLEGPFGDIEETFFSRFDYDRFGFSAALDDGTFRLRGKYVEDGVEYIMLARWYQFPRISIINSHPGQAYDWEVIRANLRGVYESAAERSSESES